MRYGEDCAIVSPITRKHFIDKEREKKQKENKNGTTKYLTKKEETSLN